MSENWCLWTVVLEKTLECHLDSKEIKSVNLKGIQPWIFTGRTVAEALVFWSSDWHRWLVRKVSDAGKDWGQKEMRASEDEMAEWHHQCNEYEFGQTLGGGEGQGGLVCYSPWGHKESDTTGWGNKSALSYRDLWNVDTFLYITSHNSVCKYQIYKFDNGLLSFPFGSPVFFGGGWWFLTHGYQHVGWKSSGHGDPQILVILGDFPWAD